MARTALTLTPLTAGAFVAQTTTNADPTNGHVLALGSTPLEEVVIIFTQTNASARVATVIAGTNPPANASGKGNITKSMAQNEVWVLAGLESARFLTVVAGVSYLYIDLAASFAGTVQCYAVSTAV